VMRKGRISAEFGPDVTKERIMAASGEAEPDTGAMPGGAHSYTSDRRHPERLQ
jgi:hypothetical protein